jgi:hypothetical protein
MMSVTTYGEILTNNTDNGRCPKLADKMRGVQESGITPFGYSAMPDDLDWLPLQISTEWTINWRKAFHATDLNYNTSIVLFI